MPQVAAPRFPLPHRTELLTQHHPGRPNPPTKPPESPREDLNHSLPPDRHQGSGPRHSFISAGLGIDARLGIGDHGEIAVFERVRTPDMNGAADRDWTSWGAEKLFYRCSLPHIFRAEKQPAKSATFAVPSVQDRNSGALTVRNK